MAIVLDIKYADGVITVLVSGTYTNDSAKEGFSEVIRKAAEHKSNKVLIDTTQVEEVTQSKLNAFDYGKFVAQESVTHMRKGFPPIKFAYLYSTPNEEILKFGETVAQNRGMMMKVFSDYQEAMDWLSGK